MKEWSTMQRHQSLPIRFLLSLALVGLFLTQMPAAGHTLVTKDGFVLQGRIKQDKTFIGDGGQAFVVPVSGSSPWLETPTSFIFFTPRMIHDIKDDPPSPVPTWMMSLSLYDPKGREGMPPSWQYEKIGDWDKRWERPLTFLASKGPGQSNRLPAVQRITNLTPKYIRVSATEWMWAAFYHPDEFGPATVKKLLDIDFAKDKNKSVSKIDKCISTAQFLAQCGWLDAAAAELDSFKTDDSKELPRLDGERLVLNRAKAQQFVNDLVLASQRGRYAEVQSRLATFDNEKYEKLLGQEVGLTVYEIKDKLREQQERIAKAERHLKSLPDAAPLGLQKFFSAVSQQVLKEMNPDSVKRLSTFLEYADVYERDLRAGRKLVMPAEQVLSLALTSWLLGNDAAEGNPELAQKLWKARNFVLQYQNTSAEAERAEMRKRYAEDINLDLDLLARLIQFSPPPQPHDKLDTEAQALTVLNGTGQYLVQLPPGYHHLRPHPLLVVLHDGGESPKHMLENWSKLAARHGYILVAPAWSGNGKYGYTEAEQRFMLDVLRDVRKRFMVDADRVFLFGLGQGAQMAYDVGLAHPDQFAGVLPMSGYPKFHAWNCRGNGQYLPFYTVDGMLNSWSKLENEKLYKDWINRRHSSILVEYKGRTMEWFGGELPTMMDWMNHKTRFIPLNEVGAEGRPFGTLRRSDNRFYWISADPAGIKAYVADPNRVKWDNNWKPNQLAARISLVSNRIDIYRSGIGKVTLWLSAGMLDFSRKVEVWENAARISKAIDVAPNLETLLEDFYDRCDRSQLFLAKITVS